LQTDTSTTALLEASFTYSWRVNLLGAFFSDPSIARFLEGWILKNTKYCSVVAAEELLPEENGTSVKSTISLNESQARRHVGCEE